ncbi:MAG TPA: galactose-1-phosphate uridylyltransferase [Pirellulaceae bacterium]|nr:galactose-1-phosphate uridylyltransferase [Pirellulaceae bacterium]
MSTLRFDPTTSDWVVFAPSRSLRPHEVAIKKAGQSDSLAAGSGCPFCPGNEAFTPPEIYSIPAATGSATRWRVRVIPNKFPALRIEENPVRLHENDIFQYMAGCGAHEVIIESPDHSLFLGQQPIEQIDLVLRTLQRRYQDLMRDPRFQAVIIFKNHGAEAGTSLAHPHWQLIATPVVPHMLRLKHFEAGQYFDRTGESLYCVLRQAELDCGQRIVAKNEFYAAVLPYASHSPFETWIMPLQHQSTFMRVNDRQLPALSAILKEVLLLLYTALDNPAFNLTINDVPRGDEDKEYFLWHIRIVPRLVTPAGFELGSGMSINTVLPEDAAAFLREVPVAIDKANPVRTVTLDAR